MPAICSCHDVSCMVSGVDAHGLVGLFLPLSLFRFVFYNIIVIEIEVKLVMSKF